MFLVEKTRLTSHFKLIGKKPSPISKTFQLAAQSFDEQVIYHLKTLNLASDSTNISLNWMSKAVSFLSMIHVESQEQISNLRSESDCFQKLYMEYSQKVLDLSNLISSAVQQLTERRMLLNLSLRLLLNSSGQIQSPEKLKKAKNALIRSVDETRLVSTEKSQRAKDLIGELTLAVNNLPIGKINSGSDLIRRTLHALGVLTVFVTGVLVTVLYGQVQLESDLVEIRVPAEFRWFDSVNAVQKQVFEIIYLKQKQKQSLRLSEVEDTVNRAVAVSGLIDEVAVNGDGDGGDGRRLRLDDSVKELGKAVVRLTEGVDELTNGVNGLFNGVMKSRNGVSDGVRKGDW